MVLLTGPPGVGKAAVLREALRGLDAVRYWAAPLPDPDHRALFVASLGRWGEPAQAPGENRTEEGPGPGADWSRILEHLLARAAERAATLRLVIEEFPRLVETRPKLTAELERFWTGVRARGLPVHLVLAGAPEPVFERMLDEEESWGAWARVIEVAPLTYREVGELFPSYSPRDRLLAWSVFGGLPRHLRPCDPELRLATNVRQAILAPEAPLLREGVERLQREFQSAGRYASLLRALAGGRREWGEVLAAVPDFGTGAQMAPYVARLQRLGMVLSEASLDARPDARARRYRIADPFLWFWHRFVLPNLTLLLDGREADVWRTRIRPHLDEHAARLFPLACREYVARYGHERLPATARELGGLWGAGYDLDPAGTLRTGAAVYGKALWGRGKVPESVDEALQDELRRTRYGFGREARLRLLFSTDGFSSGLLRRGARSDVMHLIGVEALFGA